MRGVKQWWWFVLVVLTAASARAQTGPISQVLGTAHTFAPGNPGSLTSSEQRACVFCHVPHSGRTPDGYLWNQRVSTAAYTPYQSPTMDAALVTPSTATSKLCLSCHDGTVAVGSSIALGSLPVSGTMQSSAIVGTNFTTQHPVGIQPINDGQLYPGLTQSPAVSADPAVTLPRGIVECISCHDPHVQNTDPARRRFLVRSNTTGALCLACHDPSRPAPSHLNGWTIGAHALATNTRSELYGTVQSNACQSCHLPHQATGSQPLQRGAEEGTCTPCHAGGGTSPSLLSVAAQLAKTYAHPVTSVSGRHVASENAFPLNANRHAECADCHNPHAARLWTSAANPPVVSAALVGATGVDASGVVARRPAVDERDICFKCHAASSDKPQVPSYVQYGYTASRQTDASVATAFNTLVEFNSIAARHNVALPRRLSFTDVPSLRANMLSLGGSPSGRTLTMGTYIYCGDCHNADDTRSAGGTAAAGAHGSTWPHILERRYAFEPPPATPGGSTPGVAYQSGVGGTAALCAKCHDVDGSVLGDDSFGEHRKHVVGERAACATCHEPHGVNGGTLANNKRLVNFDTRIVGPSSSGLLRFESMGTFAGRCYLRCHGENHEPQSYP